SGRCVSALSTTTGHITSDVVTNIERSAEEFWRHVIAFRDQVVALLCEGNDGNSVWFHFDFQSGLTGDVAQRFTERDVIKSYSDARACRPRDGRDRWCARTSAGPRGSARRGRSSTSARRSATCR